MQSKHITVYNKRFKQDSSLFRLYEIMCVSEMCKNRHIGALGTLSTTQVCTPMCLLWLCVSTCLLTYLSDCIPSITPVQVWTSSNVFCFVSSLFIYCNGLMGRMWELLTIIKLLNHVLPHDMLSCFGQTSYLLLLIQKHRQLLELLEVFLAPHIISLILSLDYSYHSLAQWFLCWSSCYHFELRSIHSHSSHLITLGLLITFINKAWCLDYMCGSAMPMPLHLYVHIVSSTGWQYTLFDEGVDSYVGEEGVCRVHSHSRSPHFTHVRFGHFRFSSF